MLRHPFLDDNAGGGGGETASAPTIRVSHNGTEIEIPRPAGLLTPQEVADKYVPKGTHNAEMARFRTQLDAVKNYRDPNELLADESFRSQAIEKWGITPGKTQAQFQEQIERAKLELQEREIKPRETKLAKAKEQIDRLRAKDLKGQILQAAAVAKVEDKYLKSPTKNGRPLIVSMLEDAFAFDEENGEWFAKGTSGTPFAFSQSGETPYMTTSEFIQIWAQADGKDYVRNERQGGAEAGAGGKGSSSTTQIPGQVGRKLHITPDQMRDIQEFKRLTAKAQAEGLELVPIAQQ